MKISVVLVLLCLIGCDGIGDSRSSDQKQHDDQEKILKEGTSQVGMPAIKNFRERKMLKEIYELRDQEGLTTYTYVYSDMTGKFTFLGESIGYGFPAATQFTNPQQVAFEKYQTGVVTLPQADPNGLFSPASADGTWVMLKNPNGKDVKPVYIEPRVLVSPFRLSESVVK